MFKVSPYSSTKRNQDLFDVFDDFFSTNRTYRGTLKVDVQDNEKDYVVDVDVPGVNKEDIQIHFENEQLTIAIEKENMKDDSDKNYIHQERYMESLTRTIYLKDVDPKKFKATLNNGVLSITALKQEDKISKYYIDID